MIPAFIILVGLVLGSFLAAFTYRFPKGETLKGRSKCPKCNKKIAWYDNVPLLSYILLKGKCRKCKGEISLRYPAIEASTSLILLGMWKTTISVYYWPFTIFLTLLLISIFVIDLEKKIIPDFLVFLGIVVVFFVYLLTSNPLIFENIFAGLLMASFLLLLNLVTRGRGMGLGDVKLAILGGLLLGIKYSVVWMFLSFLIGSVVGIILILTKRSKFGQQIPFGPFLVLSLFIVILFGESIFKMLLLNWF